MDGSGSVHSVFERPLAVEFAKKTVTAFADLNLFNNGGTASFVEFAESTSEGGTFTSQEEFDDLVDVAPLLSDRDYTNVVAGIIAGQELLGTPSPGTTSFMVVITDGAARDPAGEVEDPTVRCGFDASERVGYDPSARSKPMKR